MKLSSPEAILWIPTIFLIAFFTLITLVTYSEFWNVGIENRIQEYPWGAINENPWYYKNPKTYSIVMLIEGLLMSFFVIMATIETLTKKTKFSNWFFACFLLLLAMFISGEIQ